MGVSFVIWFDSNILRKSSKRLLVYISFSRPEDFPPPLPADGRTLGCLLVMLVTRGWILKEASGGKDGGYFGHGSRLKWVRVLCKETVLLFDGDWVRGKVPHLYIYIYRGEKFSIFCHRIFLYFRPFIRANEIHFHNLSPLFFLYDQYRSQISRIFRITHYENIILAKRDLCSSIV